MRGASTCSARSASSLRILHGASRAPLEPSSTMSRRRAKRSTGVTRFSDACSIDFWSAHQTSKQSLVSRASDSREEEAAGLAPRQRDELPAPASAERLRCGSSNSGGTIAWRCRGGCAGARLRSVHGDIGLILSRLAGGESSGRHSFWP